MEQPLYSRKLWCYVLLEEGNLEVVRVANVNVINVLQAGVSSQSQSPIVVVSSHISN